jgi:hypothetical protein
MKLHHPLNLLSHFLWNDHEEEGYQEQCYVSQDYFLHEIHPLRVFHQIKHDFSQNDFEKSIIKRKGIE